jgi:hypothetical protein
VRGDRVLAIMEMAGSKTNIVILDACRDNPFERIWRRGGASRGPAYMNAPSGALIAYATAPGKTARDGAGRNGEKRGVHGGHSRTYQDCGDHDRADVQAGEGEGGGEDEQG